MKITRILDITSKKPAIIVSYLTMLLNTLSSIFLTGILLRLIGDDEYGLYQMVYSVASYVMLLDMGMASVMIRYISEYRARGDKEGEENIAGIIAVIATIAAIIMALLCMVVRGKIGAIYKNLTPAEVILSQRLISIITIQFAATIYWDYIGGAIKANERFTFTSILDSISIVLTFGLTIFFAKLGFGSLGIALANLLVILLKNLIGSYALFGPLHFSARLNKWDVKLVKPIAGLMLALLIQSIVGYVNSYVDKTILGIFCSKRDVTIYSLAATILTMFNTIPGVISGLFQPKVVKMVVNKSTPSQLTDLVIQVGRWQFMLLGVVAGAFVLFGRHFVELWTGGDYATTVWYIVLVILPTNTVPLIQSVCISILNAYDKRLSRSLILVSMTGINIVLSIILIKRLGAIGAPIGTAVSYLLGHGIALNIYYSKKIHLDVKRIFTSILEKTWLPIIGSVVLCTPFLMNKKISVIFFLLECAVFCVIYAGLAFFYGMNEDEKKIAVGFLERIGIKHIN